MVKKVIFYGGVQGIGFRAAAQMLAEKYNIAGWVKNNDDGSVGLVAEGLEENIENFIDHLKKYFQDNIEKTIESIEDEKELKGFEIL